MITQSRLFLCKNKEVDKEMITGPRPQVSSTVVLGLSGEHLRIDAVCECNKRLMITILGDMSSGKYSDFIAEFTA